MHIAPPLRPRRQVRVILSSTALLSFTSVWKATALAFAELGVAAFFVMGVGQSFLGEWAPWFVLIACILGAYVRAIDIESWALFIPGGLVGRVDSAFGWRPARAAAAAIIAERLFLTALACVVAGRYAASFAVALVAGWHLIGDLTTDDMATTIAVLLIGLLWIRARLGMEVRSDQMAKGIWIGIGVLVSMAVWGIVTVLREADRAGQVGQLGLTGSPLVVPLPLPPVFPTHPPLDQTGLNMIWPILLGLAIALPAIGGGDVLARGAHEFPPPRVTSLRRTAMWVIVLSLVSTAAFAFFFHLLVPAAEQRLAADAPLIVVAHHLAGAQWARRVIALALVGAAVLLLVPAAHAAMLDLEQMFVRLAAQRALPDQLAARHPRFGTLSRAIDVSAVSAIVIALAAGGRVTWLARAYAIGIGVTVLFKATSLIRLRRMRAEPRPYVVPFNLQIGTREIPIGLILMSLLLVSAMWRMLAIGDLPSLAAAGLMACLMFLLVMPKHRTERDTAGAGAAGVGVGVGVGAGGSAQVLDAFELLPSTDLALGQVAARPGNALVAVHNPHSMAHVAAALQASGERDVVVMTVRLFGGGADVEGEAHAGDAPTAEEQQLLSQVVALAERHGRPIRLLIVPATNVFDALVSTIVRLRSSELFVGESASLSADDQARLLGDAWERASNTEGLEVRLVIHHHSGRTDAYHLGAHPPALSPSDLDLIHRVWLQAVKAIGPHVHHHDVVRAALVQMEQQLDSENRDAALTMIRQVARPADELANVVHQRDFSRLRDMVRNRHGGDLATLLTGLSIEDQVIAFRTIPRKDAAAVFEYLSFEDQEALLKAMAQEDVAALLNNMAPDDRTMFLEELPAAATRRLLALLTPDELSVALTLLGYPESSIGRLMTPHYIAVREHWTVREVLDFVREHGRSSETLNVIYVVDEQGRLIDDIRIREFLLTSPTNKVSDLMDRHFVALTATDDQKTAVAAFRRHDRTALPVTDTAGVLIGIVTIDDVLDVAEATATEEIQRIGGSEALDEPYMQIAFMRMIQKRAGWLVVLFLSEMLTATAMGVFEKEISKAVVLAIFIPLIISSGGNSGSQASTLVIRAMALGEVSLKDWFRVMRREIAAGVALGAILGTIGFLRIAAFSAFSNAYTEHWLLVGITVALTLVSIVLWGTLCGSLLPILMRRLGFDPATSSAPFVATLVDVTGLVIYFSIALVVLRGTLL
jgi:magnesium transporter